MVIGEVIVDELGCDFKICVVYGWEGKELLCDYNIIGFVIVRVGDVVGEYIVLFVDIGECFEIIYKVFSCFIFVCGVVYVVCWLVDKLVV